MKLLLGTTNAGKITELKETLRGTGRDIVSPQDFGITESPVEEGKTFQENAEQKARFYFERSGLPTLADDSGILVEALRHELGIHTRRWGAGAEASDDEWIAFFLRRMNDEANKKAHFVCCLCFIDEKGERHFFEGSCDGTITQSLEAEYLPGLPISACFKPDGLDRVYSALSVHEKNLISHRGRALAKFVEFINSAQP